MKTKIVMMTALLALLATGCGKNGDGRIRIFAENMTAAGNGSKVLINPGSPVDGEQWLAGEYIKVNNTSLIISGNDGDGYSVASEEVVPSNGALYAVYPGSDFSGNTLTVNQSNVTAPVITLDRLRVKFHDGVHDVVFPMGAKADGETTSILFKHLTAGFQFNLVNNSTTEAAVVKKLKVIVHGTPTETVTLDGVTYTVKWKDDGAPEIPGGATGTITDRDMSNAIVMNYDLYTGNTEGLTIAANNNQKLCIPVTLATALTRITVIGYNGDELVFSKTSAISVPELERNRIYPVAAITVKE